MMDDTDNYGVVLVDIIATPIEISAGASTALITGRGRPCVTGDFTAIVTDLFNALWIVKGRFAGFF